MEFGKDKHVRSFSCEISDNLPKVVKASLFPTSPKTPPKEIKVKLDNLINRQKIADSKRNRRVKQLSSHVPRRLSAVDANYIIMLAQYSGIPSNRKKPERKLGQNGHEMSMLSRNLVWQQKKSEHIRERIEQQREAEMQECTFCPSLNRKNKARASTERAKPGDVTPISPYPISVAYKDGYNIESFSSAINGLSSN